MMNEESRKAGNEEDQRSPAFSKSVPTFLLSSLIKNQEGRSGGFMNEESKKAGNEEDQRPPASSNSVPTPH
jgi:hypothetical protein